MLFFLNYLQEEEEKEEEEEEEEEEKEEEEEEKEEGKKEEEGKEEKKEKKEKEKDILGQVSALVEPPVDAGGTDQLATDCCGLGGWDGGNGMVGEVVDD